MKKSAIFMSIAFILSIGGAMISKAETRLVNAWKSPTCIIDTRPPYCNTTGVYTCTVGGTIYFRDMYCTVEYKKNAP